MSQPLMQRNDYGSPKSLTQRLLLQYAEEQKKKAQKNGES
jgi:hypothetical protein